MPADIRGSGIRANRVSTGSMYSMTPTTMLTSTVRLSEYMIAGPKYIRTLDSRLR